ncbi:hypothetical protein D3C78_837590 [compost metagenome]
MVHREHSIRTIKIFRLKKGIRWQRPAQIHPFRAHLIQHRNDRIDLFRTHMPAFTRMWIEATDQYVRIRNTKFGAQIVMQNRNDFTQ